MQRAAVSPPSALTAQHLYKRYGLRRRWALEDLNLAIPAGAVAALVGPNGAGKSTLIRTWLGFERPTQGSVRIEGTDPRAGGRSAKSLVAYVPQTTMPWPGLSVSEHIDYATMLSPHFDAAAARARIAALGLPPQRRATTLSGGERAQLILALALATPARVLLLDEPLASLDPLARRDFLRVLREAVTERRQTVVLSSHIVSDIEAICDWLVLLKGGRAVLQGPIDDILAEHRMSTSPTAEEPAEGALVGQYRDVDGSARMLSRGGEGRRPTLEEVVIGHLAGQAAPTLLMR